MPKTLPRAAKDKAVLLPRLRSEGMAGEAEMIRLSEEQFAAHTKRVTAGIKAVVKTLKAPVKHKPQKDMNLRKEVRRPHGRVELSLPWPPSVNHYWRRNKGPGMHISAEGRKFRESVKAICATVGEVPGFVAVQIIAYPPDGRARDLDNICKSLLDALQHGGVIENDSMIDDLHITRSERVSGGRVDVVVTTI